MRGARQTTIFVAVAAVSFALGLGTGLVIVRPAEREEPPDEAPRSAVTVSGPEYSYVPPLEEQFAAATNPWTDEGVNGVYTVRRRESPALENGPIERRARLFMRPRELVAAREYTPIGGTFGRKGGPVDVYLTADRCLLGAQMHLIQWSYSERRDRYEAELNYKFTRTSIASACELLILDVDGDGIREVLTIAIDCLHIYDPVSLNEIVHEAYIQGAHACPWWKILDLDGDGSFEIVCAVDPWDAREFLDLTEEEEQEILDGRREPVYGVHSYVDGRWVITDAMREDPTAQVETTE